MSIRKFILHFVIKSDIFVAFMSAAFVNYYPLQHVFVTLS